MHFCQESILAQSCPQWVTSSSETTLLCFEAVFERPLLHAEDRHGSLDAENNGAVHLEAAQLMNQSHVTRTSLQLRTVELQGSVGTCMQSQGIVPGMQCLSGIASTAALENGASPQDEID